MNKLLFLTYSFILFLLVAETPNKISYVVENPYIFGIVGAIGLYRYGLWLVHLVRAQVYEKYFYKKIRNKANSLPQKDWRPDRLYFMIASFLEDKEILSNSIKSIVQEARGLSLPATVCIGTASSLDEENMCAVVKSIMHSEILKIVFVRHTSPDKRVQMGSALRALVRQGVGDNDPVVFMDGDTVIKTGCLQKCLSVMVAQPDVDAVTTNERAYVVNSRFLGNILNLRFAIRNFHMQSLALSKKLLCLTGRFSVFRGKHIIKEEFISKIENDYIYDKFWGKIQFLSGDDKSTWFYLLKSGSKMLYLPDACIYTIEKIKNNPFKKYLANLQRWGGNMLRNNERALLLGPGVAGRFAWFILLDQRISMWTAIISPFMILTSLFYDLKLAYILIIWVLLVRYMQSALLFYYNGGINWTFPFLLYLNQVLNGFVKIYMLFHLRIQCWNNQNVRQAPGIKCEKFQLAFAKYIMFLYLAIFFLLLNTVVFAD